MPSLGETLAMLQDADPLYAKLSPIVSNKLGLNCILDREALLVVREQIGEVALRDLIVSDVEALSDSGEIDRQKTIAVLLLSLGETSSETDHLIRAQLLKQQRPTYSPEFQATVWFCASRSEDFCRETFELWIEQSGNDAEALGASFPLVRGLGSNQGNWLFDQFPLLLELDYVDNFDYLSACSSVVPAEAHEDAVEQAISGEVPDLPMLLHATHRRHRDGLEQVFEDPEQPPVVRSHAWLGFVAGAESPADIDPGMDWLRDEPEFEDRVCDLLAGYNRIEDLGALEHLMAHPESPERLKRVCAITLRAWAWRHDAGILTPAEIERMRGGVDRFASFSIDWSRPLEPQILARAPDQF